MHRKSEKQRDRIIISIRRKVSMSYTISLYTINTKRKEQELDQSDFFEKEENLEKFTQDQQSQL